MAYVEHPRTGKRHIVDSEEDVEIGTPTMCGLILPNSPGKFLYDEGECGNCKRIQ